ncbi:MAG: SIMPL domain-containing protein [Patescibacteria group bacterium]
MHTIIKNALGVAIILFMIVVGIVFFNYEQSYSNAQPSKRTFNANGEGKVIAIPDVAQLTFSVITEGGKNLSDLQKDNTTKMNAITDFFKSKKVDPKDIQTQSYSVNPRYQYFNCPPPKSDQESSVCPPPEINGYTISQTVLVKIRELNSIGDSISGAVDKGANNVSGPDFTIDDPTLLEHRALTEAIKVAKDKAQKLSEVGGYKIGKLISISEESDRPYPYQGMASYDLGGGSAELKAAPSIQAGSQEVRVNVTLTYEIE